MLDTSFFLATRDIAQRSGVLNERYRIADGRYVLDNKDLGRIRLTSEEYVTGLAGVERISRDKAYALITANGNQMGQAAADAETEAPLSETEASLEKTEAPLEETEPAAETETN